MSTLTVQTISNGTISTSSANVINGAKAWVNFNGTGTVAIRASYNVSSITDNGTGDYTINFTNAFADANYSPMFGASPAAGFSGSVGSWWLGVSLDGSGNARTKTTSALRIISTGSGGSLQDSPEINAAIFR
jgi:hypothetical protein